MKTYISVLIVVTLALHSSARSYPGTKTRPILSDQEASGYTIYNFSNGWRPQEIVIPDKPDYVVSAGQSIQEVVNEAIKKGNSSHRTYIKIEPGHYKGTVYIKGNVTLTIYGNPERPEDVHITETLSNTATPSDYERIVNVNGTKYKEGDPAWEFYQYCFTKGATIGSRCSAVFSVESADFELVGVTIQNSATDAQGLAIRTAEDKVHLKNNRFLAFQDTVGLGVGENETLVQRVLVDLCYIEGQVDYVYGKASALFKRSTFNTVEIKKESSPIIFAPGTDPGSFGFLVMNSTITGSASYKGSNKVRLARAWDHGVPKVELYVPGESPNGQLVIRDSHIDNVINVEAPYASAASSNRRFTSDISPSRVLDDNTHNRMWEYNNTGDGA